MSELTREEVEYLRSRVVTYDEDHERILALVADAASAYLDLRDGVRELAAEEMDKTRYTKTVDPDRAYRQRARARKLRALLGEDQ